MATFFDDFERANGALGGSWASCNGSLTITGGTAGGDGFNRAMCNTTLSDSSRILAKCHIFYQNSASYAQGPAVKMASAANFCFAARIVLVSSAPTLQIVSIAGTTATILASLTLGYTPPPYCELSLEWNLGHLTAMVDGAHTLEVDNAGGVGANYAGIYSNITQAGVADCRIVGGTDPSLSVSPLVIGNYGACSTVTLTGSNTAWTPGTPGSPTFTVNHGSISAQTVIDAGTATLTYCPDTYLGAVVFTDPSTGATAGAVVTSDPSVVNPGGAALSESIVAYLQRSANAETDSTIINRNEKFTAYGVERTISESIQTIHGTLSEPTFGSGGQAGILALIIQVFDLLNGGSDWGGTATVFGNTSVIKSGVDDLATTLADVQGPGGVSLAVLAAALSDLRGVGAPSLADVLAAASGGGDYTSILDAISAARGSGAPSLATLVSSLGSIRTGDAYTLGSVKGWIDGLPHGGDTVSALAVVALVAALALAIPTGGASIAAEAVAVGAGPLLDIATLVEIVSVLGELAGIASSIASIRDSLGPSQLAAPVWPGDGLATLGTSHDLADGLIVDGPMHGLIVTIDGHPNGAGKYAFGSVMSWQHCGAVVFQDDAGHYERAESFGLPSQIITPRSMAEAASATVRLNGGWSGTIRGWTVTP